MEGLNALAYTLSHDLKYILPYFNVKTGKPREYEQVIKWPSITHGSYGSALKMRTKIDYCFKAADLAV